MNLDNFKTTIIDGKPLTLLPLVPGRRVYCILYGGNYGTITAIHGTPTPQNVRLLGGGAMVMGGHADVDVAFDNGRLSRRVPEAIVYGVQWRIIDEIRSAEEITAALELCATTEAESKREAEEAATKQAAHRTETAKKYAHLERVKDGEYSSAKLGAKNIRTELKAAFPGVKFSVRSDVFSGGDSIDISWELGPTTAEVEKITGKYQEGHFNGMEDIYESDRSNVFAPMFGGAKYVHESRHDGEAYEAICGAFCELFGVEKPADGKSYWNLRGERADDVTKTARELLSCTSLPVGASGFGVERLPDGEENEGAPSWSFARYYRLTYTAPAQAAKDAPEAPRIEKNGVVAATVTENPEKGGIEIRFPAKPAASILETLKAHGWRWSRFSACWYTRATDAAREFAQSLASQVATA